VHTIYADFQRFHDTNLVDLIGATGVYVIWDAHAIARCTYIGEGVILERFTKHVKRDGRRFSRPWNGYVAIIAGSTRGVHKWESTIVERLLLDVAKKTDRSPRVNVHPGHANRVMALCREEKLRVSISGYDPFLNPAQSRPLSTIKEIKAWAVGCDAYDFDHSWRLRKLRQPII
jgi:hypothetical protein